MIPLHIQVLAAFGSASFLNQDIDATTFNFSAATADPGNASSGVRIATDSDVDERINAGYTDRDDWLNAGGTASDYEVKFTYVSGSPDAGDAAGVFHTLSSNRETTIQQASVGTNTAEVTVDIRKISDTSDAIQFTVNLEAQVF